MLAVPAATIILYCQTRSIGPGSLRRGGTVGAECFTRAYDDHCTRATYTLSSFGVDTIHSLTFSTARRTGGCSVVVVESFRVVPQKSHVTHRYTCLRLRSLVASRCMPAATISLTKLGP